MTYEESIAYLYAKAPMFQQIGRAAYKEGLDNIIAFCEALGNPQNQFKSIHIAGTNGKGSSSHFIAAILQAAGYRVGLYTSPHLKSFTERIRVNGQAIGQSFVTQFIVENQRLVETIEPSFFEVTTAMAFSYFAHQQVDVAVVEVGMGGRLDATNIITPEIALITNISYDHQEYLGDTLALIAQEKAGIIKPSVPVVISEKHPETQAVFLQKAQTSQAPITFAADQWEVVALQKIPSLIVNVLNRQKEVYLENQVLGLSGLYQLKNLRGVLCAIDILQQKGWSIALSHIQQGLREVIAFTNLKGRWQVLSHQPLVVCDIAHNEGGLKEIIAQIKAQAYAKLWIVWGMMRDKDAAKIFPLLPQQAYYFFAAPAMPRALPADELANMAKNYGLLGEVCESVANALAKAKQVAKANDMVYVGGSTFVVAEIPEL